VFITVKGKFWLLMKGMGNGIIYEERGGEDGSLP
jgi:hypothetical protein